MMKQLLLLVAFLLCVVSAQAQLVPTGLKIGNTLYRTNNISGSFTASEQVGFTVMNRQHTDSKAVLVSSDTNTALTDTVYIPANSLTGTEPLLQFTPTVNFQPRAANYNVRVELYTWSAVDRLYTVIWQPYFITSKVAQPLPVVLTRFTGVVTGAKVNLTWATASELNTDYFALEASTDGVNFVQKATAASHGTTSVAHLYGYVLPLGAGITYVRLVTVDLDGTRSYSPVLSFYPQATTIGATIPYLIHYGEHYFAFDLDADDEPVSVDMLDWSGRIVSSQCASDREVRQPGIAQLFTKKGNVYAKRVQ